MYFIYLIQRRSHDFKGIANKLLLTDDGRAGKHSIDEWEGTGRSTEAANFYQTEQIDDKIVNRKTNQFYVNHWRNIKIWAVCIPIAMLPDNPAPG